MQLSLALDCNSVKLLLAFEAGPLCESSYDLGLKKSGPCPESRIGMLSESNWKNSGLVKSGPYYGMVRIVRPSDTGSPLYLQIYHGQYYKMCDPQDVPNWRRHNYVL